MFAQILFSSTEATIVVPGNVTISMQALNLIGALQDISALSGVSVVPLFAVPLTATAPSLFVIIGVVPNIRGFVSVVVEISAFRVQVLPHESEVDILIHGSEVEIFPQESKVEVLSHGNIMRILTDG